MRSTIAEISITNLKNNLKQIRKFAGNSKVIPVVKADAYGHGIIEISKILRQENCDLISLAFADEAVKLRNEGDTGDIFVLIPGTEYDIELYVAYNLQASIEDIKVAKKLSDEALKRGIKIRTHLFINTGMNRDGIAAKDAIKFMNECSKFEGIEMIGLMTHLASSELEDKTFANKQLSLFNETIKNLEKNNYKFKMIHALNSAGIVNFPNHTYDAVRCGIAIYGYMDYPELAEKLGIEPILTLKSKVININHISPGDNVGYSLNYISNEYKKIAVVPLGYGDGYHRILSNKADCLINGKRYRIIGTICMDQCLIDVGNDNISIGDEVVFIGEQGNKKIDAYELANLMGTIPYEITTALKWRIPRKYIE